MDNNAPGQEISLLELLQVIVRRQELVIRTTLGAAVLALVISLFIPNTYSAVAKVIAPQKESAGGLSALFGQLGGFAALAGGSLGGGANTDLYLGILKSRSVADAVIKRLDLQKEFRKKTPDEARKKLANVVKFKANIKDGIITITAQNKNPKMAADIANAMVEELGRKSVQLNLTKAGMERAFLDKRLEVVKVDLKRAEEDLRDFQQKNKTIRVDSQAAVAIEGIARLKAEIVTKEVQLASLRSYQTDESPEVKAIQAALSRLRGQLATMAGSGGGGDIIPAAGNVPSLGIEYVRRVRELKVQEAIFEQLTKQHEIAKLNEAKDSSSLQVLDEAVVPFKKSRPQRTLIVLLAAVTGFFVGIFAAFILEYRDKMTCEDNERWSSIKESLDGGPVMVWYRRVIAALKRCRTAGHDGA